MHSDLHSNSINGQSRIASQPPVEKCSKIYSIAALPLRSMSSKQFALSLPKTLNATKYGHTQLGIREYSEFNEFVLNSNFELLNLG